MTLAIPRLPAGEIPGCAVDETAAPGQRVFHGDPDPIFNDAPPASHLTEGDRLHDGCAVYRWDGRRWRADTDLKSRTTQRVHCLTTPGVHTGLSPSTPLAQPGRRVPNASAETAELPAAAHDGPAGEDDGHTTADRLARRPRRLSRRIRMGPTTTPIEEEKQ